MSEGRGPSSFGQRLIGAAKLDGETYEEVEHDPGALGQAAGVSIDPHSADLLLIPLGYRYVDAGAYCREAHKRLGG